MEKKIDEALEKACGNYEFLENNSAFPDDLTGDEQDDVDCLIRAMCRSDIFRRCLALVEKTAKSNRSPSEKAVEAYGTVFAGFQCERSLLQGAKKPRPISRDERLMPRIPRSAVA
jgi:hypothetical protein